MKEARRVMLTLTMYAEVVVPATNDDDAEDIITEMNVLEYLEPKFGMHIRDVLVEIDGFEQEFVDD